MIFKKEGTIDCRETMYPCIAELFSGSVIYSRPYTTVYGYCFGDTKIAVGSMHMMLNGGDVFSIPLTDGEIHISTVPPETKVFVVWRFGFLGQEATCRLEEKGRLTYIDGCSDSILIYPPRKGDACLNHLHFPPGIYQTEHTHPTVRIGVVVDGKGFANWKNHGSPTQNVLAPGEMFYLPPQEKHCFITEEEGMNLIVFHPDSDSGPTDQDHVMLNRTYLIGSK